MDVTDLMRSDVAAMAPYAPIFPFEVQAARLGRSPEAIVKLDANENPYGTPPQVLEALGKLCYAHIYPHPESRALRDALARFTGVPVEYLLAGAGADELIDLTMRLFLLPGDAILDCPPTFGMYSFDAAIAGARTVSVRRQPDYSLDLGAIEEAVLAERPKLLFVASPNNPDGSWLSDSDLERLLELPLMVVLDEAYVEFAGWDRSRIGWVLKRENLIVLRTFSKLAGLAGLRVGYGAFPVPLMEHLWKIKQPYNVSVAASTAGIAAMAEPAWWVEKVGLIVAERDRLARLLAEEAPYLRPYPSKANFILCQVVGRDAAALKRALEQEGILIRYFDRSGLRDHVRITAGTPAQTDMLLEALRRV